jgi:glutamyl-tRNA reductase
MDLKRWSIYFAWPRALNPQCAAAGLTGDDLRLVLRQCIKTAKEIFTHTELSRKPVSVVSLAWHEFLGHGYAKDARILLIGAGQIVRNFCKFLSENGYHNLTIANRTPERAELLARSFGGRGIALSDLPAYKDGFDVLLSCTGSDNVLITEELFNTLLTGEKTTKLVIDLAIPPDVDASISRSQSVRLIDMEAIQTVASFNMQFREKALEDCEPLIESGVKEFERAFHEREVERAMRAIPETIKEIKATALGSVFARDLEQLDENSRELLEKILGYMEKKYISVPMKMAKEVLLEAVSRN